MLACRTLSKAHLLSGFPAVRTIEQIPLGSFPTSSGSDREGFLRVSSIRPYLLSYYQLSGEGFPVSPLGSKAPPPLYFSLIASRLHSNSYIGSFLVNFMALPTGGSLLTGDVSPTLRQLLSEQPKEPPRHPVSTITSSPVGCESWPW